MSIQKVRMVMISMTRAKLKSRVEVFADHGCIIGARVSDVRADPLDRTRQQVRCPGVNGDLWFTPDAIYYKDEVEGAE